MKNYKITFSKLGYNGRFGNQLFQYAALFALAKETKSKIELSWAKGQSTFGIKHERANLNEYKRKIVKNSCHIKSLFDLNENTDFNGNFQNYEIFEKYKKEICNCYSLLPNLKLQVYKAKKKYQITDRSVIFHIRGGDYLNKKLIKKFGGIPGQEYYIDGLNVIKKKTSVSNILVATDDIEASKKLLARFPFPFSFINENDIVTFGLIQEASNLVISASSFAWWASYTNTNKPIVCAPKYWMGWHNKVWHPKCNKYPLFEYIDIMSKPYSSSSSLTFATKFSEFVKVTKYRIKKLFNLPF